jgi:hypothetical protein
MSILPKPPKDFPEHTHPYSVKMQLLLGSDIKLLLDADDVQLPFAGLYTLRIIRERTSAREEANNRTRVTMHLNAFPSASEAE